MSNNLRPRYLEVQIYGQHVGWLYEADGVTRFIATDRFLVDVRRPTLSLSMTVPRMNLLTQNILRNRYDPAIYRERGELPPFFAGLLPEGSIRQRLAATRKDPRDMDDFGVLAAAGLDLPGAVTIVPANLDRISPSALADTVEGGLGGFEPVTPEGALAGAASLSGMQDKLALARDKSRHSFGTPAQGKLSDTVAKLPLPGNDEIVINEYACMKLAALAGVNVATCQPRPMKMIVDHPELVIALGAETQFLAVDRFDRANGSAVHIEDACQLLTLMPQQKYASDDSFFTVCSLLNRLSTRGIEDVRQLIVRLVVNTLLGNSDAHLKNFSVCYVDRNSPQLAPAYDIVCVSALHNFKGLSHNRAIDRRQRTETAESYGDRAKAAGISPRIAKSAVKQTVSLAVALWPEAVREMDIPTSVRTEIIARLKTLPLAMGK